MSRLGEAFAWADAPEGEEFWRAIDIILDGGDVPRPIPLPPADRHGSYRYVSADACRDAAFRVVRFRWTDAPEGYGFWGMVYFRLYRLAIGDRPTDPCVSASAKNAEPQSSDLLAALKRIRGELDALIASASKE